MMLDQIFALKNFVGMAPHPSIFGISTRVLFLVYIYIIVVRDRFQDTTDQESG